MVVEEDPPTIKENGWDGATSKSQLFDFARNDIIMRKLKLKHGIVL